MTQVKVVIEQFNKSLVNGFKTSHVLAQPTLEEWLYEYVQGPERKYKTLLDTAKLIFDDGLNMSSSKPTKAVLVESIYTRKVVIDLLVNTIPDFRKGKWRDTEDMKNWSLNGLEMYLDRINDEIFRWKKQPTWNKMEPMQKLKFVFDYIQDRCKYKSSVLVSNNREYTEEEWDTIFDIFMDRHNNDAEMNEELSKGEWLPAELWKMLQVSRVALPSGTTQGSYSKRQLIDLIIENRVLVCGSASASRREIILLSKEIENAEQTARLTASKVPARDQSGENIVAKASKKGTDIFSDNNSNSKDASRENTVLIPKKNAVSMPKTTASPSAPKKILNKLSPSMRKANEARAREERSLKMKRRQMKEEEEARQRRQEEEEARRRRQEEEEARRRRQEEEDDDDDDDAEDSGDFSDVVSSISSVSSMSSESSEGIDGIVLVAMEWLLDSGLHKEVDKLLLSKRDYLIEASNASDKVNGLLPYDIIQSKYAIVSIKEKKKEFHNWVNVPDAAEVRIVMLNKLLRLIVDLYGWSKDIVEDNDIRRITFTIIRGILAQVVTTIIYQHDRPRKHAPYYKLGQVSRGFHVDPDEIQDMAAQHWVKLSKTLRREFNYEKISAFERFYSQFVSRIAPEDAYGSVDKETVESVFDDNTEPAFIECVDLFIKHFTAGLKLNEGMLRNLMRDSDFEVCQDLGYNLRKPRIFNYHDRRTFIASAFWKGLCDPEISSPHPAASNRRLSTSSSAQQNLGSAKSNRVSSSPLRYSQEALTPMRSPSMSPMRHNKSFKTFKKSPARSPSLSPSHDHINTLTQGTAVDSDEGMNDNGMEYDNDYQGAEDYQGADAEEYARDQQEEYADVYEGSEEAITTSRKRGRQDQTNTSEDPSYADSSVLLIPKKKSSENSSSSRHNKKSSLPRTMATSMDTEEPDNEIDNEPLLIPKKDAASQDEAWENDENCAVNAFGDKVKLTSKRRIGSVAAKPREKGKRINWTTEEDEALVGGLKKYRTTAWAKILKDHQFASALALRRNTDLKDRYVILKKKGLYDLDWEQYEGRKRQRNGTENVFT